MKTSQHKMIITQFFRYVMAGSFALTVHLLVLALLVEGLQANSNVASGIGFVAACIVNYALQQTWVFRAAGSHATFFTRYALVTAITFLLNVCLFWALNTILEIWYPIAQTIATGVVFVVNFLINRTFTFKSRMRFQQTNVGPPGL